MCHENQKYITSSTHAMKKLTFFANKNHFENFVYAVPEMTLVFIIKGGISVFHKNLIFYSYFMKTFPRLFIVSDTIFQQLSYCCGHWNKVPPT